MIASAFAHNLASVAGAAAVVGIGWLAGDAALRRVRSFASTGLERALFAIALGLGFLSTAAFLVGVAGAYTTWSLRALLAVVLVIGLYGCFRRHSPALIARPTEPMPFWVWAIGAQGGLLLVSLLPSVLTPMVDHDGLAYHVGAPKRWLELGAIVPLPTQLHTLWPMGEEMLNGILLATVGDGACKPLMFLFAVLAALATVALGARLASPSVGVVGAVTLIWRAGAPSVNTTSVEMPLTFFVVLTALAIAMREGTNDPGQRRSALIVAGSMAGIACATKLNGLLCLFFLGSALALLEWRRHVGIRRIALIAGAFIAVALVAASPWFIRTWWLTGNPVYPFAFGLLGGRGWDLEAARILAVYFRTFDLPGDDIAQRWAFVQRHLVKLVAMMAVGLALPGSPRWVRGFILGAGLFAIFQAITSDNPRFMLPLTPFAGLALGWWMVRMAELARPIGWVWAAGFAILAVPRAVGELKSIPPVVWGGETREAFILRYVNNRTALEWANTNLPADARVLYGPDNRTYFLSRETWWSCAMYQRDIDFRTPETFDATRRAAGIKYLILNRDVYRDWAISFETNMGWRRNEKERLLEAAEKGRKLFEALGVEVYELP